MATSVPRTNTKWATLPIGALTQNQEITLNYPGKKTEADILATASVVPDLLWAGGEKNHLYYGNNLPFLAHLLNDQNVCGKVRLVYIDPPFATNGVFQSRQQNDAYHDLITGYRYIEFLRQRLILLRELLAEDGSIYVHLDENMVFHIKLIMDELFGAKNYRNLITRRKSSHKNYTRKTYGNISDYILFYSKSASYVWNRPLERWTDERALKEYNSVEPETGRRYKKVPVHAPGVRNGATGGLWRGMSPPPGKHWQYTPHQLDEMDARGEIYWSPTGNPRRKIYLENSEGVPLQDIWYEFRDTQNQNARITGYPTEKNPALLDIIIEASSNPDDLVLDCFAGSGTTLAEASKLNRRWIGMDDSFLALQTMLRRFAHGATPMGDFVTKPGLSEYEQMNMFLQGEKRETKAYDNEHVALTDFILHGNQPIASEVVGLIKNWQGWIEEF
jgi:adenine-specific DNA-methyltransferase